MKNQLDDGATFFLHFLNFYLYLKKICNRDWNKLIIESDEIFLFSEFIKCVRFLIRKMNKSQVVKLLIIAVDLIDSDNN